MGSIGWSIPMTAGMRFKVVSTYQQSWEYYTTRLLLVSYINWNSPEVITG